jgi:hypothetical protein
LLKDVAHVGLVIFVATACSPYHRKINMSTLDLKNVQGDILLNGLPKRVESFFFFQIADGHIKDFCRSLKTLSNEISHVDDTAQMRRDISNSKGPGKEGDLVEMAGANIAFSWKGLQKVQCFHVIRNDHGTD